MDNTCARKPGGGRKPSKPEYSAAKNLAQQMKAAADLSFLQKNTGLLRCCHLYHVGFAVVPSLCDLLSSQIMLLYAVMAVMMTYMAPEIVRILATEEYYEAIYIMPPIAAGVFFTAFANIYSDIAVYYKKTQYVMYPAVIAAVANLVLSIDDYLTAVLYICLLSLKITGF